MIHKKRSPPAETGVRPTQTALKLLRRNYVARKMQRSNRKSALIGLAGLAFKSPLFVTWSAMRFVTSIVSDRLKVKTMLQLVGRPALARRLLEADDQALFYGSPIIAIHQLGTLTRPQKERIRKAIKTEFKTVPFADQLINREHGIGILYRVFLDTYLEKNEKIQPGLSEISRQVARIFSQEGAGMFWTYVPTYLELPEMYQLVQQAQAEKRAGVRFRPIIVMTEYGPKEIQITNIGKRWTYKTKRPDY